MEFQDLETIDRRMQPRMAFVRRDECSASGNSRKDVEKASSMKREYTIAKKSENI